MFNGLIRFFCNLFVLRRVRDTPPPFDPSKVNSILVVRNDNIGDVVCSTPAIATLRRAFPKAKLGVLVCGLTSDVVAFSTDLDRVHVYHKAKHGFYKSKLRALYEQGRVMRQVRREKYDLAIGLRAVFSTSQAWLVYHSRAGWRLGRQAPRRKARLGFFYNITLPEDTSTKHEVERSMDVLRRIGLDSGQKILYLEIL